MKKIILGLMLSTSAFAACPDLSGQFQGSYPAGDYRKNVTIIYRQVGCEKIERKFVITFNDGLDPSTGEDEIAIADAAVDAKWFWDAHTLTFLQRNANSEQCDLRETLKKDVGGNLRYRWRFECRSGVSPWYSSDVVGGLYMRINP